MLLFYLDLSMLCYLCKNKANRDVVVFVPLCCVQCARFNILSSFFSETKCKPTTTNTGGGGGGGCFTTQLISTCKNSGTFEGKNKQLTD